MENMNDIICQNWKIFLIISGLIASGGIYCVFKGVTIKIGFKSKDLDRALNTVDKLIDSNDRKFDFLADTIKNEEARKLIEEWQKKRNYESIKEEAK